MLVFAAGIRNIRGILLPAGFYLPALTRLSTLLAPKVVINATKSRDQQKRTIQPE
jgi:hypothetical protein